MERTVLGVPLAMALLSCGRPVLVSPPDVRDADQQLETCRVARDPLNPFIVEWPATGKSALEAASLEGGVIVSYVNCNLKVLPRCRAVGSYTLTNTTPARDMIDMRSESELYARLPLGAAQLKGEVAAGSYLTLDYVAVGQKTLVGDPSQRTGECEGATHYVASVTLGAFSLDARASATVGGVVDLGIANAGAGHDEGIRRLKSQGDVDACAKDGTPAACGAILQLGLAPLPRLFYPSLPPVAAATPAQIAPTARLPQPQPLPTPSPTQSTPPPAQPVLPWQAGESASQALLTRVEMALILAPAESQLRGGMTPVGGAFAGHFLQGQTLGQPFNIEPGKCYAIVAVSTPSAHFTIAAMELSIVFQPLPTVPPQSLATANGSHQAVLGSGGGCFRNPLPIGGPARAVVKATAGQGTIVAQVYAK